MLIVGRKYKIIKPRDTSQSPIWASSGQMDQYDGMIITYKKSMKSYHTNIIDYDGWLFNDDWLHLVSNNTELKFMMNLIK